jgi:site-specific DNA-methyltransferase (adenine-specific)
MGKVINGDCFEVLDTIDSNSVDLVLTDPPYGVIEEEWDRIDIIPYTTKWLVKVYDKIKEGRYILIFWSVKYMRQFYDVVDEVNKIVGNCRMYYPIIWHHRNTMFAIPKFMRNYTYTPVFVLSKGSGFVEEKQKENCPFSVCDTVFDTSAVCHDKLHCCQKPIELLTKLINRFSYSGEIVLDPFAGSGSTGVACIKTNRDYILIEKDISYYNTIVKRLEGVKVNANLGMF